MNVDGEEITLQPLNTITEAITQRKGNQDDIAQVSSSQQKANERKANDM